MSRITVEIPDDQVNAFNRYAASRGVATASLIAGYVAYLLTGGEPIGIPTQTADEITRIAAAGGAIDWLRDEPELYCLTDGEPA